MNQAEILTPRQRRVLSLIVEEYTDTGEPVGSITLEKKYELGVSPATIRNEMVALTQKGFLIKPHASAGRIPTSYALKYYVSNLMQEEGLSISDEVGLKERLWGLKDESELILKQATRALAELTDNLAVALTDQGQIYHSGYANILNQSEFFDLRVTRALLSVIEEIDQLKRFFNQGYELGQLQLVFGDDLDIEYLEPIGAIFTQVDLNKDTSSWLGVIGPCRLNFPRLVPIMRHFKKVIQTKINK